MGVVRLSAITGIVSFTFDRDRIAEILSFQNPDKLEFVQRQAASA
jgi:hypothetical protein